MNTYFYCLLLAGILLFGCKTKKNAEKAVANPSKGQTTTTATNNAKAMEKINWKQLAKGNNSGVETAQQVIIKTQADWEKAWKQAYSRQMPAPACPELDFSTQYVLACYAGMGANGGYGIEIASLTTKDKNLQVKVQHIRPGSGCMTTEMVVYPFVFISIENAQQYANISFETEKLVKNCQ